MIGARPCPIHAGRASLRRSVSGPQIVRAAPDTATKPSETEDNIRFKWDPANARWTRIKADKDKTGKYGMEKWEEAGAGVVQTKSGGSYTVWPMIHAKLQQRGLKSLRNAEAKELVDSGKAILVDARSPWNFEAEHAVGAVNVPLFVDVAGREFWDTLKKWVVRIGFNMRATERDPEFREKALQKLDKDNTLIVYCQVGGTLKTGNARPDGLKEFKDDPERAFGRESRSLKACFELQEAGFKNVLHLEGGLSQWRYDNFPTE